MNLYYEMAPCMIADCGCGRHSILAHYDVQSVELPSRSGRMDNMHMANRVWEETDTGVRYIKYRAGVAPDVDMEEFMWIKLKSTQL